MLGASNPVQPVQDRAEDLLSTWKDYGYVMFPQQRRIYEQIADRFRQSDYQNVLEAGCGNGVGSGVLDNAIREGCFQATDSLESNVKFAECLYPWIDFQMWDICQPWTGPQADTVVCVECLEHVADPRAAVRNLLEAARREVWISTPNGRGKPRPPSNPFHVCEYTFEEMVQFIREVQSENEQWAVHVLGWEDFQPVPQSIMIDPLVYHVVKEQP